jgi:hypothetical protein
VHGLYKRNLLNGRSFDMSLGCFAGGTLLLMDMWQRQEVDKIDDVKLCLETLGELEKIWQMSGIIRDILTGLLKLTETAMTRQGKRRKLADNSLSLPHLEPLPPKPTTQPSEPPKPRTPQTFPPSAPLLIPGDPLGFEPASMPSFLPSYSLYDGSADSLNNPEPASDPFAQYFVPPVPQDQGQSMSQPEFPFIEDRLDDPHFTDWLSAMVGATAPTPPNEGTGSDASSQQSCPLMGSSVPGNVLDMLNGVMMDGEGSGFPGGYSMF